MRELVLIRNRALSSPEFTRGVLLVMRGSRVLYSCFTLELGWKNNKRRESCIPNGEYPIVLEYSPKFETRLWELKDVPGRSEIKIHPANKTSELLGCIAVGKGYVDWEGDGVPEIVNSRNTLNDLHGIMRPSRQSKISVTWIG